MRDVWAWRSRWLRRSFREIDWSGVPPAVAHYIAPDYNHFGFFPWAAYLSSA